jgi:hypothetical protein
MLAVTGNRSTPRRNTKYADDGGDMFLRFLQEPHGVTSEKTAFFIVTTVKTSILT